MHYIAILVIRRENWMCKYPYTSGESPIYRISWYFIVD